MTYSNIIKKFPANWEIDKYYNYINQKELREICLAHAGFFHTLFGKKEQVLLLPVEIAGAVTHPTKLIAKINNPSRLDICYIDVKSFEGQKHSNQTIITQSPKLPALISNANVVIIDVIYDSGNTIDKLFQHLQPFEQKSISIVIVISKQTTKQITDKLNKYPQFKGISPFITVPDGLFYRGYGLDDSRCLPVIQAKIPKQL